MYSFGNGETFFHTCNANSLCSADDINFHQVYINPTTYHYYLANLSAGSIVGIDHINTGDGMTNLRASKNCEYKAEILNLNSGVDKVLLPSKIGSGSVTFNINGTTTGQFDLVIGDASALTPTPRLLVGKSLPYSFAATQSEKDRIAQEFNDVGSALNSKVVLKRRCTQS